MLRVLLYPQEQRAFIPISANQDSWRRGSNFPRDMQIFRLSRHHLAERASSGKILEENREIWSLGAPNGALGRLEQFLRTAFAPLIVG